MFFHDSFVIVRNLFMFFHNPVIIVHDFFMVFHNLLMFFHDFCATAETAASAKAFFMFILLNWDCQLNETRYIFKADKINVFRLKGYNGEKDYERQTGKHRHYPA